MQTVTLNNGKKMPQLGLGVWKADNGQEAIDAIHWALEAGYRHIDTASIYKNEEAVGEALKTASVPREEVWLTTKIWNDDIDGCNLRQHKRAINIRRGVGEGTYQEGEEGQAESMLVSMGPSVRPLEPEESEALESMQAHKWDY